MQRQCIPHPVMPAPVAGIRVLLCRDQKTWMAGSSPAMTKWEASQAHPLRQSLADASMA